MFGPPQSAALLRARRRLRGPARARSPGDSRGAGVEDGGPCDLSLLAPQERRILTASLW